MAAEGERFDDRLDVTVVALREGRKQNLHARWLPGYSVSREQGLQLVRSEIAVGVEHVAAVVTWNFPSCREVRRLDDRPDFRDRAREAKRFQDRLRCVRPRANGAVRIGEVQLVDAEGLAEICGRALDFHPLLRFGETAQPQVLS